MKIDAGVVFAASTALMFSSMCEAGIMRSDLAGTGALRYRTAATSPKLDAVGALLSGPPGTGIANCSGTLINRFTFLTAAHCIGDPDFVVSSHYVGFGPDAENPTTFAKVVGVRVLPGWAEDSDLAVVQLYSPLSADGGVNGITPLPISSSGPPADDDTFMVAAGYGLSGFSISNDTLNTSPATNKVLDDGFKRAWLVTTSSIDADRDGESDYAGRIITSGSFDGDALEGALEAGAESILPTAISADNYIAGSGFKGDSGGPLLKWNGSGFEVVGVLSSGRNLDSRVTGLNTGHAFGIFDQIRLFDGVDRDSESLVAYDIRGRPGGKNGSQLHPCNEDAVLGCGSTSPVMNFYSELGTANRTWIFTNQFSNSIGSGPLPSALPGRLSLSGGSLLSLGGLVGVLCEPMEYGMDYLLEGGGATVDIRFGDRSAAGFTLIAGSGRVAGMADVSDFSFCTDFDPMLGYAQEFTIGFTFDATTRFEIDNFIFGSFGLGDFSYGALGWRGLLDRVNVLAGDFRPDPVGVAEPAPLTLLGLGALALSVSNSRRRRTKKGPAGEAGR